MNATLLAPWTVDTMQDFVAEFAPFDVPLQRFVPDGDGGVTIQEMSSKPVCWSVHWCDVDGSTRGEFASCIIDPAAGASQEGAEAVAAWMNARHPGRYHYASSTRLSRIELP